MQNLSIERFKNLTKGLTPSVNNYKEVAAIMFDGGKEQVVEEIDAIKPLLGCLEAFVDEEYYAIDNAVYMNGKTFDAFTKEEFKWYILYCLKQRILWIRNEQPDFRPQDSLWFPAIISVLSQNIGVVTADREGLIIKPDMSLVMRALVDKNMTKARATEISRFLEKSVPGYQGAKGYVKAKEGCADFMLMQVIGNDIKSTRHDSHPVYALLASFVGIKLVDSAILPTQKYAEFDFLKTLMSQVTSC